MIEFRNITKSFKDHVVLKDINMTMKDGELTVIIGPSGCGKTTSLKMINRLISPTQGEILIDGEDVSGIDKVELRRRMGYVIQSGGLFPHMTIRENIEIIEQLENKPEGQIMQKTIDLMDMVDMDPEEFLDRYPSELSGGQLQRIGVARAFANDPEIILLDEPFSALDPITRASLQDQLVDIQAREAKTMVFVTHDMSEAIKLADRICIMNDGHIIQFDTPEKILRDPADGFVANFVGTNRIWSSPEYIRVEDFMIKNPVTIAPDVTVGQCIRLLREKRVDSLLVTDESDHFLGVLDKRTFIHERNPATRAIDVMLPPEVTARPGDNILQVLESIRETVTNNVPVITETGKLVGLLTSSNLVSTLSKQFILEGDAESDADEAVSAGPDVKGEIS